MPEIVLLEKYRKQLRYRANHRGIKEMDIILGGFADRFIQTLNTDKLRKFEEILECSDHQFLLWLTGEQCPPNKLNTALFKRICLYAKTHITVNYSEK